MLRDDRVQVGDGGAQIVLLDDVTRIHEQIQVSEQESVHVQLNAILVEMIHQVFVAVSVFDLVFARQTLLVHAERAGELASQRLHELVQQPSAADQPLERVVIVQFGVNSGQMKFDLVASDRVSRWSAGGQFLQTFRIHIVPCSALEIGRVVFVGQIEVSEITNMTVYRLVFHMQILIEQCLLLVLGAQRIRVQQPIDRELVGQIRFPLLVPIDRIALRDNGGSKDFDEKVCSKNHLKFISTKDHSPWLVEGGCGDCIDIVFRVHVISEHRSGLAGFNVDDHLIERTTCLHFVQGFLKFRCG